MWSRRQPNAIAHAGVYATSLLLLTLLARGQPAKACWNQFRGPNGQGVAQADRLPVHFGPETNVLWKTVVPAGHSSPVIWGNHLFLTASGPADTKELVTLAIDRREGRIRWRQAAQAETQVTLHPLNNTASSSPAADEPHVYVYFGTYGLLCYDHAGNQVWQRRLDTPPSKYGMATSPILHKDTVILALDGDNGSARSASSTPAATARSCVSSKARRAIRPRKSACAFVIRRRSPSPA